MKKITQAAMAGAMIIGSVAATFSVAQARVTHEDEFINRDRCYVAQRIPARVEYNTRGVQVSGASRSWSGTPQEDGATVVNSYHDPVFIQTRRIVEDQHVTLVPTDC